MTEEQFIEAAESNLGYCKVCKEFTTDFAEPDARGYACKECGEAHSVFGAEEALLMGLVEFTEEDEE